MVIQIHKSKKDDQVPAQKKKGGGSSAGTIFSGRISLQIHGREEGRKKSAGILDLSTLVFILSSPSSTQ